MDYPENEREKDRKTDKESRLQKQKIPKSKGISEFAKEERRMDLQKISIIQRDYRTGEPMQRCRLDGRQSHWRCPHQAGTENRS